MIKKIFLILAVSVFILSAATADVFIKDIDGVNVEVIFTFKAPSAQKVSLAGSMNGWSSDATPMTKNADGIWEYVLSANIADEITYKFVVDGSAWTYDEKSPDSIDDGYGGKNGLVSVTDVYLIQNGAKDPNVVIGSDGIVVNKSFVSKLTFGMETQIESETYFSTQGARSPEKKGLEVDDSKIKAKSIWRLRGELFPDVTTNIELKFFDASQYVWAQDATGIITTSLDKSIPNLVAGLFFNPANYFYGNKDPSIENKLRIGINTPYINIETARGDIAIPGTKTFFWDSAYGKNAGDGGWLRLELGPKLRTIGDVGIEAVLIPNKAKDGNYALTSWVTGSYKNYKAELQYSYESKEKNKLSKMFDGFWGQDIIFGASAGFGSLKIMGQTLFAFRDAKPFSFDEYFIGQMSVSYAADFFGVSGGYRYTGKDAYTLFGNGTGDANTQQVSFNASVKPLSIINAGFESNVTLKNENTLDENISFWAKPYVDINLDSLLKRQSSANVYAKMLYRTKPSGTEDTYRIEQIGAKMYISNILPSMPVLDVYYALHNNEDKKMLNTLSFATQWKGDVRAEISFGLRTFKSDYTPTDLEERKNNPFGFAIGASWKIPAKDIKNPVLYGNFGFNLDPYQGGSSVQYLALDGYYIYKDKGVDHMNGKALLRFGLLWNY